MVNRFRVVGRDVFCHLVDGILPFTEDIPRNERAEPTHGLPALAVDEVDVLLRGSEARVSEQLRDHDDVGALVERDRRDAVPRGVRSDLLRRAELPAETNEQPLD